MWTSSWELSCHYFCQQDYFLVGRMCWQMDMSPMKHAVAEIRCMGQPAGLMWPSQPFAVRTIHSMVLDTAQLPPCWHKCMILLHDHHANS